MFSHQSTTLTDPDPKNGNWWVLRRQGLLPFNQHLRESRPRELLMPARIARDWASQRDLAKLGPVSRWNTGAEGQSVNLGYKVGRAPELVNATSWCVQKSVITQYGWLGSYLYLYLPWSFFTNVHITTGGHHLVAKNSCCPNGTEKYGCYPWDFQMMGSYSLKSIYSPSIGEEYHGR